METLIRDRLFQMQRTNIISAIVLEILQLSMKNSSWVEKWEQEKIPVRNLAYQIRQIMH